MSFRMRYRQAFNTSLFTILLLVHAARLSAQQYPERPSPPRLVNDFASILNPEEQQSLEKKLVAYDDSTSTQIAIVVLKTLDGFPIEDYTFELAERWGVGRSKKDNGIMILIAFEDRKVFIASGYGMEGTITDARAKNIIENSIKPNFKEGRYRQGLEEATSRIIAYASGEYVNDEPKQKEFPWMEILAAILFIALAITIRVNQVKRYARINHLSFWTAWMLLNQTAVPHRGSWGGFSGRGGSSGGGFGGFGGGSFGGGGAGGSW